MLDAYGVKSTTSEITWSVTPVALFIHERSGTFVSCLDFHVGFIFHAGVAV